MDNTTEPKGSEIKNNRRQFRLPLVIPPSATLPRVEGVVPTVQWVTVTPTQAMHWLGECNQNNRTIRDDHVMRLAADMAEGKWRGRNGEPIKFDTNGHMFEGQHRCWACVMADVPFETLLITGCDPVDYNTSGTGRQKSYSDFIRNEKNTHLLAAALKLVYFWSRGELTNVTKKSSPTNAQMDVVLKDHPRLRDSVNRISSLKEARKLLTSSFCCLIHYAGTIEGRAATVDSFLERLGNGLGLLDTDPVYHLRRFLLGQRSPQPGKRRPGQMYILALAIKAWNASKSGSQMRALQFKVDEKFPQL